MTQEEESETMKKRWIAALLGAALLGTMTTNVFAASVDTPAAESGEPGGETAPVSTDTPGQTVPGIIATDVTETDWFYNAVVTVLDIRVMTTTEGRFEPRRQMTREQIATALYLDAKSMKKDTAMQGPYAESAPDYIDVSIEARDGIRFCYRAGILTGDANGNLRPQDNVTREEMAALLQRYCAVVGLGDSTGAEGMAVREFTDYDSIQEYAHVSIQFCMKNGILRGNADGTFHPKGYVTRAECAQMITNIFALAAQA